MLLAKNSQLFGTLTLILFLGCSPEPTDIPDGGAGAGGSGTTGGSSSAGTSPGGVSTGGGSNGGSAGTSNAGQWHGCKANISDATLNGEYTTWKSSYVVDCGDGRTRVQTGAPGSNSVETYSASIGYGMLLTVAFDDRPTFDSLWAYYQASLDKNGLMDWKMNACTGERWGVGSSSDADLDVAMALLQADRHWGGYANDANGLIDAIHAYETLECDALTVLKPGDAWGDCTGNTLNPAYFSPAYYRAFALFQASDPAKTQFWTKLADDSMALLISYQSQFSGALVPEWANASGGFAAPVYAYNACRTPWRMAADYGWWGTAAARTFLTNVSQYVDQQGGVAEVPFANESAFLGSFALSGIATDKCDSYYESWMSAAPEDSEYYLATLRVIYLMTMAGRFTY